MKNLLWCFVVAIAIVLTLNPNFFKSKNTKTFVVTADTNISKNSRLSKYVTQEEVDGFAFRYWDIDKDKVMNNDKMENLRQLLKSKNTQEILAYMKDNNISVDEPLHYGVTPLMYASFYDDINTAKELLNLGADPHKKDKYKLSPMAYAIENNATKSVKLLYDNGVKFDEITAIQTYLIFPTIKYAPHNKFIVDDNYTITYVNEKKLMKNPYPITPTYFLNYATIRNFTEIIEMVLKSGYKPFKYFDVHSDDYGNDKLYISNNLNEVINIDARIKSGYSDTTGEWKNVRSPDELLRYLEYEHTLYSAIDFSSDYKQIIDLFVKYNVYGYPSDEFIKDSFNECREAYKESVSPLIYYIYDTTHGIEREKERLLVEEYEKKYYKQGQGSISEIINLLIKNEIIVRKPKSLDELDELGKFKMKQYTDRIKFYEKHCGIKDFKIESLMDWDTEEKKKKDPFGTDPFRTVVNWEKEPIDKNETFENFDDYARYKSQKMMYDEALWLSDIAHFSDINMTVKEFNNYMKELDKNHTKNILAEVQEAKKLMKEKFKK